MPNKKISRKNVLCLTYPNLRLVHIRRETGNHDLFGILGWKGWCLDARHLASPCCCGDGCLCAQDFSLTLYAGAATTMTLARLAFDDLENAKKRGQDG